MCSKSQALANPLNSWDDYCGPLSDIAMSGIPYLAYIGFMDVKTLLVVVEESLMTFMYLKK